MISIKYISNYTEYSLNLMIFFHNFTKLFLILQNSTTCLFKTVYSTNIDNKIFQGLKNFFMAVGILLVLDCTNTFCASIKMYMW